VTRVRSTTVAALAAASLVLLAACGGQQSDAAPTTTATVAPGTDVPETTPSSTPTEDADAVPTCETLILPSVVEVFEQQGWTAETQPFHLGPLELPDGLWCAWGDYTVASDNVQIFGWAPIPADTAREARADLVSEGWQLLEEHGRVLVTERPETALHVDEDGFGMTYEFGDGWVTVSDTRQGLLLIERPDA